MRAEISSRSFSAGAAYVEHEWVCVRAQFGNDEWDALGHQARDKGEVSRSIQLCAVADKQLRRLVKRPTGVSTRWLP